MSIAFGLSPLYVLVGLVLAGGLTYWSYRSTQPTIGPAARWSLMALRFMAFILLLFLLGEPVIRWISEQEEPPALAVLVDASESIPVGYDSVDGAGAARDVLKRLSRQEMSGNQHFYTFGTDTWTVDPESLLTVPFDEPRTNITRALNVAREQFEGGRKGAVLLISDGQYNDGRNPIYPASRFPVPIHTVVLGDTTKARDIQIRSVRTNDIAYANSQLPVEVRIRAVGFPNRDVEILLRNDGSVLDTAQTRLTQNQTERAVRLSFEPEQTGLQQYVVEITNFPEERTKENNTHTFNVRILDRRKRVLVMAGAPGPDVRAFHQVIQNLPSVHPIYRTQKTRGTFYQGSIPSQRDTFDVLALINYPGPASVRNNAQQVGAIAANTPVLFMGGNRSNIPLARETLGESLPVIPENTNVRQANGVWELTAIGEQHPILEISELPHASWQELPPLSFGARSWRPSPDTEVLAHAHIGGESTERPVLVIRQRSSRRSAALLGERYWQWHNLPPSMDNLNPAWPRLVSNTLQWLTAREAAQAVKVEPVEPVFDRREPAELVGQVYDENMEPVDNASVAVEVQAPDGQTLPYQLQPEGHGRYREQLGYLAPGQYQYRAHGIHGDDTLGTDQGTFAIGSTTIEYLNTGSNRNLLQQVALRSGGRMLVPDSLGYLPEVLEQTSTFEPSVKRSEFEFHLLDRMELLLVILVLLIGEWSMRKWLGLV